MHSPLDLPTVQALGEYSSHPSVQASANAWLAAYSLAHQLAFTEAVAMRQADTDGTAPPSSGVDRWKANRWKTNRFTS